MKVNKMQQDFEVSTFFLFKYNLGFANMAEVDAEALELRMPN